MTDLDDRIRRLIDSAAPVTLDEARYRHAAPARSHKFRKPRRRLVAAVAAVAVVVAVVVAVAAARHPGGSTTVSVGVPARTGSAETAPVGATTATCTAADLSLGVGSYRQAGGQFEQTLTFTNRARTACQLAGWPTLAATSPGHVLKNETVHVRQNLPPQPAWRPVTLRPGHTASFDIAGGDYNNVTSQSCPTASSVTVTPPGTAKPLLVEVRFPDCGALDVTPIVAGTNDSEGPGETVPIMTPTTKPSEASQAGLPTVLRSTRLAPSEPSKDGPRYLAPGTPVPAADVRVRVRATPQVSYGLANLGGSEWPGISTDGGRTWRIDGPLFAYPAMQGASAVDAQGTLSADVAYAWGHGGNFVRITYDAGRHWWQTAFPDGIYSVTGNGRNLQTRALGDQTATGEFKTFLYISSDQGRTWKLHGQLGDVPY